MFNKGYLVEDVAEMIDKNLKIVHITKEEQKRLDVEKNWKTIMPEGWTFEQDQPYARLLQAKIEINFYN